MCKRKKLIADNVKKYCKVNIFEVKLFLGSKFFMVPFWGVIVLDGGGGVVAALSTFYVLMMKYI